MIIVLAEGESVTLDVMGEQVKITAGVVREADVQVDKSRRWPEYPKLSLACNGHIYTGDDERLDADGLTVWLGEAS